MYPVLTVKLGSLFLATTSYRFFLILAAAITVGFAWRMAVRAGFPSGRASVSLLAIAMAVPIGARLWDAATKNYLFEPSRLFSADLEGFSLYGGLLLAVLVGLLACRVAHLDPLRLADLVAPALGTGIAVVRIGCFLAGSSFGTVTDLPWGVIYPVGSEPHLYQLVHGGFLMGRANPLPVHPTQLYEALAGLIGMGLAIWVLRQNLAPGSALAAFAVWFDAFRLLNHNLRAEAAPAGAPEWFYPALYATILLVGAAFLGRSLFPRKRESRDAVQLQFGQAN